jgi:glycerol uptake facilitator-like aquaporin
MPQLIISEKRHKVPFFDYSLPESVEYGKFRFTLGEDWNNRNFKRACWAEFIAMMYFVVMCCGCAMVTLNLNPPNLMMVAASFGFGILVLAQFIGPLSGGHINCAVSFGLFVGGRISFVRLACYTFSQMGGSVLGAFFLWAIFGNNWPAARAFGSNSWDESVFTGGQVFLAEIMGTMLLVYNVFATIDIPTAGGGPLGVFPIAMSVMVSHLFLLPIDGCSINPTRSFGPSLVAAMAGIGGSYYHQQYMFWFGPLIGAAITAVIYGKKKNKKHFSNKRLLTKIFRSFLSFFKIRICSIETKEKTE